MWKKVKIVQSLTEIICVWVWFTCVPETPSVDLQKAETDMRIEGESLLRWSL